MPFPSRPGHALPHLTGPCPSVSRRKRGKELGKDRLVPISVTGFPTLPRRARPCHTRPYQAYLARPSLAHSPAGSGGRPRVLVPGSTSVTGSLPCPTLPCLASPYQTRPSHVKRVEGSRTPPR